VAKALLLFLYFLTVMTLALQTPFEQITVTGDESNNSGVWGPPAAGGQRGFGGRAPNAATIFQLFFFFQKIKHFYAYFGLNFCLETSFK